jgi:hypothetical protein
MRDGLRNLYSVIKGADAHIRFAFLTGVSKFSKVSLFSGLNNLRDITVDRRVLGHLRLHRGRPRQVFAPELTGLDREQIRAWYNGYNWTGEAVYNPFDVLLLFQKRQFRPWWFETATPTFLVDLLLSAAVFCPRLGQLLAERALLSAFDVEHIATEALLFQTGYLTIDAVRQLGALIEYRLRYPNLEVYQSLNGACWSAWTRRQARRDLRPSNARCTSCCWPTTSPAWRRCSRPSSPASRTTGTATTPSPATRATTPASSTPTSPPWGWT